MIDLHTHSSFSDGSLTPEGLVAEGVRLGLTALALTDHDSVGGVDRFLAAAKKTSLRGIPGVEISADVMTGSVHILGYFVEHHNPALAVHLASLCKGRKERNDRIVKNLNALGVAITLQEAAAYAGENNVGRLHFAQALVARGYVANRDEAFKKYLAKGKPGYADRLRFTPAQGIALIRQARGVAVLAHPFATELDKASLANAVRDLVAAGLQGIEVHYPQHTPRQVKQYLALVKQYDLVATGGTDFHGAPMPDIHLGTGFGGLAVQDQIVGELEARIAR